MSIAQTVAVTVAVQDTTVSTANFGTILILAYHTHYSGVREYEASPAGLTALVADGFHTYDPAYMKAAAIVAQNPHTASFKVARRAVDNTQTFTLTPKWYTSGNPISLDITVKGVTTTITQAPGGVSIAAEATALQVLIDAVTGCNAVDSTGYVTVNPTTATERIYVRNVVGLNFADTSADAGIATDLATAQAADSDWFGLVIDTESAAEIAAAGAWALSNEKIFGALSADANNFTSAAGVAHTLKLATNHATYVVATRDTLGCAEAGLMGRQFSRTPGSTTWAHKQIAGAVADGLTETEFTNARANGAITYVNDGVTHTYDGWAAGGRYLDITQGIAWLKARIREAVLIVLVNNEKLGFVDSDAAIIEAAVAGVLAQAETNRLLAPGWSTSRPPVASVSAANKLNRIMPDIKFKGVLQGAIQKVLIDGTLTV